MLQSLRYSFSSVHLIHFSNYPQRKTISPLKHCGLPPKAGPLLKIFSSPLSKVNMCVDEHVSGIREKVLVYGRDSQIAWSCCQYTLLVKFEWQLL